MSKIGRKPIDINGAQVTVKSDEIQFKGSKGSGTHIVPKELAVKVEGDKLHIVPAEKVKPSRDLNRVWGLTRALVANKINGVKTGFEKKIEIIGLGYKAQQVGDKLVFALGYSHKKELPVPKGITITIDKTGQKLTLTASDREVLGKLCSDICFLRLPEPYKGTGIKLDSQVVFRKAGKTK